MLKAFVLACRNTIQCHKCAYGNELAKISGGTISVSDKVSDDTTLKCVVAMQFVFKMVGLLS